MSIRSDFPLSAHSPFGHPASRAVSGRIDDSFAALLGTAQQQADQVSPSPGTATGGTRLAAQRELAAQLAASNKPVRIEDLRSGAEAALSDWYREARSRLESAGFKLRDPLQLRIRPEDGKIELLGERADKAAIEQFFVQQQELTNSLRGIAATLSLVQAADRHAQFTSAYEQDPLGALRRFEHLFADRAAPLLNVLMDDFDVSASLP